MWLIRFWHRQSSDRAGTFRTWGDLSARNWRCGGSMAMGRLCVEVGPDHEVAMSGVMERKSEGESAVTDIGPRMREAAGTTSSGLPDSEGPLRVAILTGGGDKPYALGIASALTSQHIHVDFIGSDRLDSPELHGAPLINFLNLRGDQRSNVSTVKKALR